MPAMQVYVKSQVCRGLDSTREEEAAVSQRSLARQWSQSASARFNDRLHLKSRRREKRGKHVILTAVIHTQVQALYICTHVIHKHDIHTRKITQNQ